ncbi:MAG: hypothetical protein ACI4Q6_05165 [Huintestinicola sp.]
MGFDSRDELACERLISSLKTAFGKKRDELLSSLCGYRTRSADEFWSKKLGDDDYLPYIMCCRSEKMSDIFGKKLSEYVDSIVNDDMEYGDMCAEGYFLLSACLFKESDELMSACSKVGRNYEKIRSLSISWDKETFPEERRYVFLSQRRKIEIETGTESDFLSFLTDTLIMTAASAVLTDGENETFTEKLKELFEKYPEAFFSAGFFAYFIKDSSEAYDRFESYLSDPIYLPKLLWVLDGLECADSGQYTQGSPTFIIGKNNRRAHFDIITPPPDIRWYSFFTERCLSFAEESRAEGAYFCKYFCKKISERVYDLYNEKYEEASEMVRRYFLRSCVLAGNPVDFAGLARFGDATEEELVAICKGIAERICIGKQTYCFHVMFYYLFNVPREYKLSALNAAADILREKDNCAENAAELSNFLMQLESFENGQQSIFESNNSLRV